ncbi:MAG: beta-N-acetylhexosaminidase, partial [Pseudonocardiales bacterium]|nr:beta-N-acetylhexosaminidase [Pseudonocardiales bacterium]
MGRRWWVATAAVLLAATACSTRSPTMTTAAPSGPSAPTSISAPQSDATPSSASSAPPKSTPAPPVSRARQILAGMSLAERVGQLLMVDCPSTEVGLDTVVAIGRYHVGSVILDHTSFLTPQQTSTIVTLLTQRASPNVGLFVATDQEGGQVQRLLGPGFTTIPTAVQQGTLTPATLRRQAQQWGSELHAAGVNVNLAPV